MPVTSGGHRGLIESSMFAERYGAKILDLSIFGEEHLARIRRYRDFWRLYKGMHWQYERGGGGDPDTEPFVTLNYARRIVDVHVNFLMKEGWEISIPDDPETPEIDGKDRAFVKHKLDKIWEYNDKELFSFEFAQAGAITGDAFARVFWRADDPLAPPYPAVEVLPSQFVFPEYGGKEGTDRKKMRRVTIALPRVVDNQRLTFKGRITFKDIEMWSEVWTPEFRELWKGDELVLREDNVWREIPIVHVPNYPVAGEVYGMSDLHAILDLQKSANETATDIQDVIAYHGSPTTILSGAKISELEKGAGRVWAIPADADVKNLELEGDLAASNAYLDRLMNALLELSGTPKAALGGLEKITGTSGATLSMTFLPLLESRAVKIRAYSTGLRKINRLMLRAAELKDPEFLREFAKLPKETRYFTAVTFPSPLPRDAANDLNQAILRIENGLSTRKRELIRDGYSESEADDILREWQEEQKAVAQAEFEVGQFQTTAEQGDDGRGNPNPRRPNPDVQGEAVARKAGTPGSPE